MYFTWLIMNECMNLQTEVPTYQKTAFEKTSVAERKAWGLWKGNFYLSLPSVYTVY